MAADDVTIIGGGWSVRDVNLERLPGLVIAVNDSALLAPRWDFALSMDRLWTEHRIDALERLKMEGGRAFRKVWLRRSAVQNLPSIVGLPWVQVFDCDHTSSACAMAPYTLNGSSSGACALNLAYQLAAFRVFLLGFDMNRDAAGRAYWYPPYPWVKAPTGATSAGKYNAWALEMESYARQFHKMGTEVFNVSPGSAIECFPKLTPAQFLKETA